MEIEHDLSWVDRHWSARTWNGQHESASRLLEKAMLQILRDHYRMTPRQEQREAWQRACTDREQAEDSTRRPGTAAEE